MSEHLVHRMMRVWHGLPGGGWCEVQYSVQRRAILMTWLWHVKRRKRPRAIGTACLNLRNVDNERWLDAQFRDVRESIALDMKKHKPDPERDRLLGLRSQPE